MKRLSIILALLLLLCLFACGRIVPEEAYQPVLDDLYAFAQCYRQEGFDAPDDLDERVDYFDGLMLEFVPILPEA